MDYAKVAGEVIRYVGGKENIRSVTHCATRLRLQLRDNSLRNEEALSDVEGEGSLPESDPISDYLWIRDGEYGLR